MQFHYKITFETRETVFVLSKYRRDSEIHLIVMLSRSRQTLSGLFENGLSGFFILKKVFIADKNKKNIRLLSSLSVERIRKQYQLFNFS